jgi:two-component system chemotaxis sensor kinase CheA
MNPLLNQFITEARDFLQSISQQLLALEQHPEQSELIIELFRLVHTLKGNSGLFEFGAMSKVLHAAEDVMDTVRDGKLTFSPELADKLLDCMDFVAQVVDSVAEQKYDEQQWITQAVALSRELRQLLPSDEVSATEPSSSEMVMARVQDKVLLAVFGQLPVSIQSITESHESCYFLIYQPEEDCYFKGEDPFYLSQQIPQLLWGAAEVMQKNTAQDYDCFRSVSRYLAITTASVEELNTHFRYVAEQVHWCRLPIKANLPASFSTPITLDFAVIDILQTQQQILQLDLSQGALASVRNTLIALEKTIPSVYAVAPVPDEQLAMLTWVELVLNQSQPLISDVVPLTTVEQVQPLTSDELPVEPQSEQNTESKFGRRAEDLSAGKVLKVEQSKIDRLMDLIGEIVVAKNSLPYLASKAEEQFGVRELSRDIKAQYAVINRIVEEMQDAIMQVRMLPVSFIFQRFPRLVRDIARKLNKEVELKVQGEETEADKSIIESLADPLIHILRNSLDHGFETVEERLANGKSPVGVLKIRASQEADRVLIVIEDDGRGIDPVLIKRKAWEKQLISEVQLESLTDQDAIQLIFAPGFSTASQVTDLSGRGVGMDVVKTAVNRVGGTVRLDSTKGQGTKLTLSLPLSMAVTNVMVIGADGQIFGIPMDLIVETVRLPFAAVRSIKQQMTTVLRGRIIPLIPLNQLLGIQKPPLQNDEQELALLVVRSRGEVIGILVDDFYEVIDIILKPLPGELAKMPLYAGSALLGDGSVLLILNPQEFC